MAVVMSCILSLMVLFGKADELFFDRWAGNFWARPKK